MLRFVLFSTQFSGFEGKMQYKWKLLKEIWVSLCVCVLNMVKITLFLLRFVMLVEILLKHKNDMEISIVLTQCVQM